MEGSTNHASTVFNKVLIPVLTTVLGATAIYFLGFNKKSSGRTDMEQMLISKDATVKAWRSFVTSQNIGFKSMNSLSTEYSQKLMDAAKLGFEKLPPVLSDFKDELLREAKKSDQDIQDILKDQDVDRDFVSMLNRILINGKDEEKKVTDFVDKLIAVSNSNSATNEKATQFQAESVSFDGRAKNARDRMAAEAEAIAKVLAERYNQAFNLNDLDIWVDYLKEKNKKPDDSIRPSNQNTPSTTNTDLNAAPADPNAGQNTPNNLPQEDPTRGNNQLAPTAALMAGQWEMTGGILELSRGGDMYWSLTDGRYTYGNWQLVNGTLRMNGTNPDTKRTVLMVGSISGFTKSSFTLTLESAPKEVYHFKKKEDY